MQWACILLACGSAVLTVYIAVLSIALMDAQAPAVQPIPLRWLLPAGIAGIIGGGAWVQLTWQPQQAKAQQPKTQQPTIQQATIQQGRT
jgi:hypothetical protein